jgi:hypothetical protein
MFMDLVCWLGIFALNFNFIFYLSFRIVQAVLQFHFIVSCYLPVANLGFRFIQVYNFSYSNIGCPASKVLISDIKGRTWTEGVREPGAEEDSWTEERWSDRMLEKTA